MCSGPQFYATFLNATSSVRVATMRCALSSRCRRFLYPRPRLIQQTEFGVDAFHYAKPYFGAAVVENAVQMIGQHVGQFLKGGQALPAKLIYPSFQVAHRRVFVLIIPEMVQASFNGSEQEFAGEGHFTRLSSHW